MSSMIKVIIMFPRCCRMHADGYREGIEAGRDRGLEEGFKLGVQQGLKMGSEVCYTTHAKMENVYKYH
jgi:flagellar biosynthesis/type III secretory pathway protein FliH